MPAQTDVSRHYTHGSLTDAIRDGLASLGKAPGTVTVDDLAPVDEFHIGGRKASEDFLDQLGFRADKHVLDVGCGLGGAARFVASRYGSRVTGIDLTSEYVETGKTHFGISNPAVHFPNHPLGQSPSTVSTALPLACLCRRRNVAAGA